MEFLEISTLLIGLDFFKKVKKPKELKTAY
jgi:hypothetical protein